MGRSCMTLQGNIAVRVTNEICPAATYPRGQLDWYTVISRDGGTEMIRKLDTGPVFRMGSEREVGSFIDSP